MVDLLPEILSKAEAKAVGDAIYQLVGFRDLRRIMTRGKWKPMRGIAQKIIHLSKDPEFIAKQPRHHRARRCSVPGGFRPSDGHHHPAAASAAHAAAVDEAVRAVGGVDAYGQGALARALAAEEVEALATPRGNTMDEPTPLRLGTDGGAAEPARLRPQSAAARGASSAAVEAVEKHVKALDVKLASLATSQEGLAAQVTSMASAQGRIESLLETLASRGSGSD